MNRYRCGAIILFFLTVACEQDTTYQETLKNPESYQAIQKQITDVIVYDIFSPPVASRIYAYSNIAAFETLAQNFPDRFQSLGGQVTDFTSPQFPIDQNVNPYLASIHACYLVGKTLIFSEDKLEAFYNGFIEKLEDEGLPSSVKSSSVAYGKQVADHVMAWADKDMYKQTRTFPKYTVKRDDKYWKPTPPDYMDGIEPHWKEIRPLIIDSANQFVPKPPLEFNMDSTSEFYSQLKEVYDVGVLLDTERVDIAKFWDCNPYVSHHRGHAMFATKKITPGGHWMGITAIANRKANSDFLTTVEAFTRTSISLFDGFIACWDEKWRSLLVRPETLINQYMDEEWKPLLQTPPFPEYTSGHSVISRAAAVTLTNFYGENFSFNDTSEMDYGLDSREFDSFIEASDEAAISRLYGGIHYMMAIKEGVEQGRQVGEFIVKNLETSRQGDEVSLVK